MLEVDKLNETLFTAWMRYRTTYRGVLPDDAFIAGDLLFEMALHKAGRRNKQSYIEIDYYYFEYNKSDLADSLNRSTSTLGARRPIKDNEKNKIGETPSKYDLLANIGFEQCDGFPGQRTYFKVPLRFDENKRTTYSTYYNNKYTQSGVYQIIEIMDMKLKDVYKDFLTKKAEEINYKEIPSIMTFMLMPFDKHESQKRGKLVRMLYWLMTHNGIEIEEPQFKTINKMVKYADGNYYLVAKALKSLRKNKQIKNIKEIYKLVLTYIKTEIIRLTLIANQKDIEGQQEDENFNHASSVVERLDNVSGENKLKLLENEINNNFNKYNDEDFQRLVNLYENEKMLNKTNYIVKNENEYNIITVEEYSYDEQYETLQGAM